MHMTTATPTSWKSFNWNRAWSESREKRKQNQRDNSVWNPLEEERMRTFLEQHFVKTKEG